MRASSSRLGRWVWWGAIALAGCLPELEDPPLTATGEAPAAWTLSGSGNSAVGGGAGSPSTNGNCVSTYTGNLSEPAIDLSPPPCIVKGDVTLYVAPSAKLKTLLSQVKQIEGTLSINADVAPEAALPQLTAVTKLQVYKGGLSKTLTIPQSWKSLGTLEVVQTELAAVQGGLGLQGLTDVSISWNKKLITVNLLGNGATLGSAVVAQNSMLKNLVLGTQCKSVGQLELTDNTQLANWEPMAALTQAKTVRVFNSPMLQNIRLPALQSVTSLELNIVGGKLIELPALTTVGALNLNDVAQLQALEAIGPMQVSQSVRLCVQQVPCVLREAWLQKHAPGLTPQTCTTALVCKS